jgi:hypothetical protein
MPAEHRKKLLSDTWHFCSNCTKWPTDRFIASLDRPTNQLLCEECRAKNERGECTTSSVASLDPLITLKKL